MNFYAGQKLMIESNDWHEVYFFDWDDVRDGCLDTMQQQFELLWSDAGRPPDAALFSNRLITGGRHIYFSPVASRIASSLLERSSPLGATSHPTWDQPSLPDFLEKRLLSRKQ